MANASLSRSDVFSPPSTAVREDFLRALNDGLHQSNCSTQFEKARTNYSFLRAPRFEERPSAEEWAVEAAISLSNDKERQKRFLRLMGDRRNASLGLLKRVRESGDLRYGIKEKYSNLTKRLNREYEEAVKLTRILRESRLNLFHEFNFSLPAAAAQNHYHHVRGSSHMDGGGSNCSKTNGSDNFDERNRTLEKANISNDNRL
eukprot:jgi/Bigna1/144178/aug1.85_g18886